MQQFEQAFENLDVVSGYVSDSLQQDTMAPVSQVDDVLRQIAEANNLEVESQLAAPGIGQIGVPQQVPVQPQRNINTNIANS